MGAEVSALAEDPRNLGSVLGRHMEPDLAAQSSQPQLLFVVTSFLMYVISFLKTNI